METETARTEVMSLRMPTGTVKQLRKKAHQISLETGQEVTWNGIVREAIENHLLRQERRG